MCQRIMRNDTAAAEKRPADLPNQMHMHRINSISRLNIVALTINTLTLTFLFSFQMPYLVNECF